MTATDRLRGALGGHMPVLDGARGLAIALVLVHNFSGVVEELPTALDKVLFPLFAIGWVGVQLFFVLSGFLITGLLVDAKRAPAGAAPPTAGTWFGGFYARRALRIFPIYYLVLAARFLVLPHLVTLPAAIAAEHVHQVWYWTYLQNWAMPFGHGVTGFSHLWSLAVEEQFYLAWPLLVWFTSPRALLRVCFTLAAGAFLFRAGVHLAHGDEGWCYLFTVSRVDALAIGGALALVARDPALLDAAVRRLRPALLGTAAALVALVLATKGFPRANPLVQTFGYSLLAAFFAMLLLAALLADARAAWARALASAPLRTLGKYSYALYVLHYPLQAYVAPRLALPLYAGGAVRRTAILAAWVVAGSVVSLAAAVVSWHLVEKRFLALKRYFPAGGSRTMSGRES